MINEQENDDEFDIDGCDCECHEQEITADEDLPPAEGGVES